MNTGFERERPLVEATLKRIARGIMRYVIDNPEPFIVPQTHPVRAHQRRHDDLVAAFMARHYGGHENDGHPVTWPLSTVTTQDHHHLVTSHLVKFKGTSKDGQAVDEPLHTVQANGLHYGEVRAFLMKYYGTDQDPHIERPLGTITTKDRFGVVTVRGERYAIVDIGMRMLTPRELARASSFPDAYILDPIYKGKPLSKTDQVWMIGNAVPPAVAEALVRANLIEQALEAAA